MSDSRPSRQAGLWLILAAACWGVGTAVSKQAVNEIPPLTVLAIQLAVSVVVLTVVTRILRPPEASSVPPLLARLGVLNPGVAYALGLVGLTSITVSTSVLLWALEPLLILGLAVWLLHERVHPLVVALSAAAIAGVVLVVESGPSGELAGVLLTVAGVGCCAMYTVGARRWLPGTSSSALAVVRAQQTYALAFSTLAAIVTGLVGGSVWSATVSLAGWVSVVVSGLLYYTLAYVFYLSGLRRVRASLAAVSFYLVPIFGIAAGLVYGERLDGPQWVGAAVVIGAVAVIATREGLSPA